MRSWRSISPALAIAIAVVRMKIDDIKEEIELCNRYFLLHKLPPVWYLGVFFGKFYSLKTKYKKRDARIEHPNRSESKAVLTRAFPSVVLRRGELVRSWEASPLRRFPPCRLQSQPSRV